MPSMPVLRYFFDRNLDNNEFPKVKMKKIFASSFSANNFPIKELFRRVLEKIIIYKIIDEKNKKDAQKLLTSVLL